MILTNFKIFVKLYKHNDISSKLSKCKIYINLHSKCKLVEKIKS